jgi:hypothetical protein
VLSAWRRLREPGGNKSVSEGAKAMKRDPKSKRPKPVRGHPPAKSEADGMNEATGDEFEREGMGIAPKE